MVARTVYALAMWAAVAACCMAAAGSSTATEPQAVQPASPPYDTRSIATLSELRELDRRARMDMILYRGRFSAGPEALPAVALTAIPTSR